METQKDWLKAALESYKEQLREGKEHALLPDELLDTMPENGFLRLYNLGFTLRVDRREIGGQAVRGAFIDPHPRQLDSIIKEQPNFTQRFCD